MKKRYFVLAVLVLTTCVVSTYLYLDYQNYKKHPGGVMITIEDVKLIPDESGNKYESYVNNISGCKSSESVTKETFDKFAKDCMFTQYENRLLVKFPFDTKYGNQSIIADIPNKNFDKINILIVGGPLSYVRDYINTKENSKHKAFVGPETAVFVPQYIGTQRVSIYPNSDTEAAAKQIASYISRTKFKSTHLIGHSGGGLIATIVHQKIKIPTTIIATPLISLQRLDAIRKPDFSIPQRIFQRKPEGGPINDDNIVGVPSQLLQKTYFGRYYDRNLIDDIIKNPEIKLIYGEQDFAYTIPRANLPNFESVRDRICMIPGMGHMPETIAEIEAVKVCMRETMPSE
jgi:hypothetical protein